ncbi:MAG: replicative DNA helicase [Clostridiales bacterium]|nr:replicative DNA helicase [Clostridiales bacterium]
MSSSAQRVPPHSIEAEQSVLGSMLLDANAVTQAMETLTTEDFYTPGHQKIYAAMASLHLDGQPVDLVTVLEKMNQQGTLESAGGMEYLTTLSNLVPTTANVSQYIKIVEDRSVLRGVIDAGSHMVASGYQAEKSADDVVADAHDAVYALAMRNRTDSLKPLKEGVAEALVRVAEAAQRGGGIVGTPSGFADLDKLTAGFEAGQLVILAARPGMGKTSFALNLAHNAGVKHRLPVAIFSLEMPQSDLALRMICAEARVSLGKARAGTLDDEEFGQFVRASTEFNDVPIYIDDSGSATVPEIRARCMRFSGKERKNLGLVIIDYLQLMSATQQSRAGSRTQEISELTRQLKLLARDLKAPILLLSQLNRDIERRQNKTPMMADLRESGSIEQDADIIMFLASQQDVDGTGDEYDYDEEESQSAQAQNGVYVILAKNRNGPAGENVLLYWNGEYTKFSSPSDREEM